MSGPLRAALAWHVFMSLVVLVTSYAEDAAINRVRVIDRLELTPREELSVSYVRLPLVLVGGACAVALNTARREWDWLGAIRVASWTMSSVVAGCSVRRDGPSRRCLVIYAWEAGPATREHEVLHCEGWGHDDCPDEHCEDAPRW